MKSAQQLSPQSQLQHRNGRTGQACLPTGKNRRFFPFFPPSLSCLLFVPASLLATRPPPPCSAPSYVSTTSQGDSVMACETSLSEDSLPFIQMDGSSITFPAIFKEKRKPSFMPLWIPSRCPQLAVGELSCSQVMHIFTYFHAVSQPKAPSHVPFLFQGLLPAVFCSEGTALV